MTEPILMGNVCVKANGHTQWRGERDYGTCGGHFGADIMLVPHDHQTRDIDWEGVALSQGERENWIEDMTWELDGLRAFVSDLANAGIRFDLNPTVDMSAGSVAYVHYLARIDKTIRERAADALSIHSSTASFKE